MVWAKITYNEMCSKGYKYQKLDKHPCYNTLGLSS